MIGGALAMGAPRRMRPWFADKPANHTLVMDPRMMAPVMIGARSFRPQRSAARPCTDDELRSVGVPLLVLTAERSTLLHPAPALERAFSLVLRAEGEVVPGVGHGLPFEAPDYVDDRILKFIETERD
jgi:pimeloyl-ACP methyl ester carboxylesterase